jgi:hypothetical protein
MKDSTIEQAVLQTRIYLRSQMQYVQYRAKHRSQPLFFRAWKVPPPFSPAVNHHAHLSRWDKLDYAESDHFSLF